MQYRSDEILLIDPDGAEPLLAKLTEPGFSVTIDGTLATAMTQEPWGTDQALIQIATGLDALAFWNWVRGEDLTVRRRHVVGLEGTIADYDPQGPWVAPRAPSSRGAINEAAHGPTAKKEPSC